MSGLECVLPCLSAGRSRQHVHVVAMAFENDAPQERRDHRQRPLMPEEAASTAAAAPGSERRRDRAGPPGTPRSRRAGEADRGPAARDRRTDQAVTRSASWEARARLDDDLLPSLSRLAAHTRATSAPRLTWGEIMPSRGDLIMARELKPLDIGNTPELLRVAEEVQRTRQPRRLQRNSQDVAIVIPVPASIQDGAPEEALETPVWADAGVADPDNIWADYDPVRLGDALQRAQGALAGLDLEELLRDIYEGREQDTSTRPA